MPYPIPTRCAKPTVATMAAKSPCQAEEKTFSGLTRNFLSKLSKRQDKAVKLSNSPYGRSVHGERMNSTARARAYWESIKHRFRLTSRQPNTSSTVQAQPNVSSSNASHQPKKNSVLLNRRQSIQPADNQRSERQQSQPLDRVRHENFVQFWEMLNEEIDIVNSQANEGKRRPAKTAKVSPTAPNAPVGNSSNPVSNPVSNIGNRLKSKTLTLISTIKTKLTTKTNRVQPWR